MDCGYVFIYTCHDFKVGADLTATSWGFEGQSELDFGALMQAMADFSVAASATLLDVTNACKAIAVDLGEPDIETKATLPDRADDWCARASQRITTAFPAGLHLSFQPPSCAPDAGLQSTCEAICSANAHCRLDDAGVTARCDAAQLEVVCGGTCTGSCEGTADLSVNCAGVCAGTCDGTCVGGVMDGQTGVACDGTCMGGCRGSCSATGDAAGHCAGGCKGGCSAMATAARCDADLKPPSPDCSGSALCSSACQLDADAKAACRSPAVAITPASDENAAARASLGAHLPGLLIAISGRGQRLAADAQQLLDARDTFAATLGDDRESDPALCLIPATDSLKGATANAQGIVSAVSKITASLGLGG